jgi:hypothetical protein
MTSPHDLRPNETIARAPERPWSAGERVAETTAAGELGLVLGFPRRAESGITPR